ncbi:MAG: type II secretion system GspH family protein [Puniceicoccales bacterium]|jgi:prepilin-type N-terminal cleavage/methylation domain-containing protein|nr:type II secretion system GspH family protein [Puniceicoccales bacterium]
MKKNAGMSLLEVILAITLLSIVAPSLFVIFFSNVNLCKRVEMRTSIRQVADDVRSFIQLTDYSGIRSIADGGDLLAIREVEENGLLVREFIKNGGDDFPCDFAARLEVMNSVANGAEEQCAIPLRCRIYHVKQKKLSEKNRGTFGKKLQPKFDAEYSMFLVKNM